MSLASSTIQSSNISFDLRTSHYLDQQTVTLVYPAIKMLLDQTDRINLITNISYKDITNF
jgi:hypothetical protein